MRFPSMLALLIPSLALLLSTPTAATAASGRGHGSEPLLVFAAASLQGPLDDAADAWTGNGGRRVAISYAASSALARQIEQGAPADVFVSADSEWMDWLAERDRIDAGTRVDLLGNELVLIAPATIANNRGTAPAEWLPSGLGADGRLAVADVYTVPAGRYAKQALEAIGRWDDVAGRLAMGDNVRAALAFVARAEAPLGIVYATDARAEPKVRVVARFSADTHAPIVYPVAAVADADPDAAAFVRFLRTPSALARFAAAGFVPLPPRDAATAVDATRDTDTATR